MTLLNILFLSLLVVTTLTALIRGGQEEKIGIGIYVLGCALTVLAGAHSSRFASEETGIFVVDCLTFAAFFILALYADRFWPIWVAALLAIALFGHAAMLLSPGIVPWAYAVVLSIWSYPILAIMLSASLTSRGEGRATPS